MSFVRFEVNGKIVEIDVENNIQREVIQKTVDDFLPEDEPELISDQITFDVIPISQEREI